MPNRILKQSIRTSPEIDALSPWEETFFYRLLVSCDDYGRMDARPMILKSALFPLKTDVKADGVLNAVDHLEALGLIKCYLVDGLPYLQLVTWGEHQNVRSPRVTYPPCLDPVTGEVL